MTDKIERREFVKWGAVSAVGAGLALPGQASSGQTSSAQTVGANDRIVLGFIGTGRQGQGNMKSMLKQPDANIAAICDVYAPNLAKAAAVAPNAEKYTDFRKILDRKDINAVVISTPDHWHALQTVMACQAGKDVYVEKPSSLTIEEGRKMVRAAEKYKRVVQVGTQQRSGIHFQKAVELVRGGRIGKVTFVRCWNYGNSNPEGIGNPPDTDPPADLDWDMWLGPAPKVRFNKNRFGVDETAFSHFRWFWDYAGGMMTDWGVHWIDIVQWAMNVDHPQSVSASGGKFFIKDNRETPDTISATYEYPGFVCTYENRMGSAAPIFGKGGAIAFHGTEGTLLIDRSGFEIIPEKRRINDKEMVDRMEAMKVANSNDHGPAHARNFLDCIKSRQKPICDMETGHRSTSTALLGNVAYRSRQRIAWDGKNERIAQDREASRYLSTDYRKPWSLKV